MGFLLLAYIFGIGDGDWGWGFFLWKHLEAFQRINENVISMQVQSLHLARLLHQWGAAAAADDGAGHGGGDAHCG